MRTILFIAVILALGCAAQHPHRRVSFADELRSSATCSTTGTLAVQYGATVIPLFAGEAGEAVAAIILWYEAELQAYAARRPPSVSGAVASLPRANLRLTYATADGALAFYIDGFRLVGDRLVPSTDSLNSRADQGEPRLLDLTGGTPLSVPVPSLGEAHGRPLSLRVIAPRCRAPRPVSLDTVVALVLHRLHLKTGH
ncbi:MAG: hypothetical protein IV100_26510 [Myxococcales bacterium]|nr:hypothetical protein [Myxococcales bacterium]